MKLALIKQILHKLMVLLTGATFLAGTGALPIVPSSMTYVMAYRYPVKDAQYVMADNSSATSTSPLKDAYNVKTVYSDIDGDGWIANAVFKDSNNNLVVVQIPDSQYIQMTQKGGIVSNPTKTQFTSVFQALATPVSAAIAFDASATGRVTATSLTFAHTMSSTANGYLFVGVAQGNNVDDVTSVAYNGTNATQLDLITPDAYSLSHQYSFGLANPSTGTNNVVVSRTASGELRVISLSYTGVNQVSIPNGHGIDNAASNSPATFSATTTLSTTWAISCAGWQRSPTLSTGYTQRQANSDNAYKCGDSNGVITSPYSFTYTYTGNAKDDSSVWITLAPAPVINTNPSQDLIITQDE